METNSIVQTTSGQATAQTQSQKNPVISSDFETFLKMLTAQAKYQNPLEPIDSTQFASQLAQFSAVEQQVQSNDLLAVIAGQLGASNLSQYAGWVGMEAKSSAPVSFDGNPVTLELNPVSIADQADLVVRNATGNEVQRIDIPVKTGPVEWAGVSDNGSPFAAGIYSFEVESHAAGKIILSEAAQSYARVIEIRISDSGPILVLDGEQTISPDEITALRSYR